MDGYVAKLPEICDARRALRRAGAGRRLPRDRPSRRPGARHAGADRRGRPRRHRHRHVRQDARRRMGGFVAAAQPIVDLLRQRARPYLFSNSLAPPVAAGSLKALEIAIARRRSARARSAIARAPLSRRAREGGLHAAAGRDADHPGDARRSAAGAGDGAGARRARRLCRRLLLSRRAEGRGAHPHPDVGGADARRTSTSRSPPSPTPARRAGASV